MSTRLVVAAAVRTAAGVRGDSVLIADGRVAGVGEASALRSADIREDRYPEGVIVPGLRDAHLHPVTYAAMRVLPSLKTAASFAEVGDRLRDAADRLGDGVPLTALRLDDESLAEGRLPTRSDLDSMVGDRPLLLHRYCGHISVANTAALDLAGVDRSTPDPPGGSLDRDDSGVPNGILREDAIDLVAEAVRRVRPESVDGGQLVAALEGLAGVGLTSIGAIVNCGVGTWADLGNQLEMLAAIARHSPIRLNVLVSATRPEQLRRAAEGLEDAGPTARFLGLKVFSDGSLGGHTALMHEPFSDAPSSGALRLRPDWTREMGAMAMELGGMVAIHAIGDRANTLVLDLMQEMIRDGADPRRLRIEHASVLTDADIPRFGALGITASVQPAFMTSETQWLEKRVGPQRLRRTYPLRSLLETGAPMAGGSDSPVEPPHPLWGMAAARDRAGINPGEGLSPEQALALFTDGAARALDEPAPLAVGSPADFVVLDVDPVAASPDQLRRGQVLATWIGGRPVGVPTGAEAWPE